MKNVLSLLILVLIPFTALAQYEEEWQVAQEFYERGILYFDYNGDDKIELTKMYGNTVTVYNGANSYEVLWSLADDNVEYFGIWDIYDILDDERLAIFIGSNSTEALNFRLTAYEVLGSSVEWHTDYYNGEYSYIASANLDNDDQAEIVFGYNLYLDDQENYESQLVIVDSQSGDIEYSSNIYNGYMAGPYVGDIDTDDNVEILFNIYDYSTSMSTLHVYTSIYNVAEEPGELLPKHLKIGQNYPNPFNPSTTIPLLLLQAADVSVKIYNVNGQLVKTILTGHLSSGEYKFHWDGLTEQGTRPASGIYFYEIETDDHQVRRPMVLLK